MLKVKFRFRPGHRDSFTLTNSWHLKNLFLNLTEQCNLRCKYCHASFSHPLSHIPLGLVSKVLDQLVEIGRPDVILTGGEPFLHPNFREVLEECHKRGLGVKIATNGTYLDETRIGDLVRFEVKSLQISLDTLNPNAYSAIKGVGANIQDDVINGIRLGIETGQLHMVISSVADGTADLGLTNLLRFCHDENINTFTLYHVIPYGRAFLEDVNQTDRDFLQITNSLIETFSGLPNHWGIDLGVPCIKESALWRKWKDKLNVKPIGCIAGKSSMTVLTNGEVVPCVCMEDNTFSCGNIKSKSIEELWNSPVMRLFRGEIAIPSCNKCPSESFCLGGCRTLAYLSSKKTDAPDPICQNWKQSLII
jgi:radical SAM protein with 4Fe4S-binding SPASM domain